MITKQWLLALAAGIGVSLSAGSAFADFDWGSDCSSGEGEFTQAVPYRALATVGTIPAGKRGVEVLLDANNDVDVQLIDVATGTQIIAWPNGLLNGAGEDCATYEGVEYCYSGYNGTGGNYGDEYIRVNGATNRALEMRVYGYQSGDAEVNYRWSAVSTCNEVGSGAFSQFIPRHDSVVVGEIPRGKVNVTVELDAVGGNDIDIRLFAGDIPLVAWPSGRLNGAGTAELEYGSMTITYSGYNGIDGDWGNERIEISGSLDENLRIEAFGYQAGNASVTYAWGAHAGDACDYLGDNDCPDGLDCRPEAGSNYCHAGGWCATQDDCPNMHHGGGPGQGHYSCEEFLCVFHAPPTPPADECGNVIATHEFMSHNPAECATMTLDCGGAPTFSNLCGCGCDRTILYQ